MTVRLDNSLTKNTGDGRYLKLDQTTPQTITGLTDGVIELINGVIGTRVVSPAFTYFV